MFEAVEQRLRSQFTQHFFLLEAVLYISVAILLVILAFAGVVGAAVEMARAAGNGALATGGARDLDQLLLILILVELIHTVRLSVRSQELRMEPFLVVGLIAAVRRVLVITLQSAQIIYTGPGREAEAAAAFRRSMIELGLLAVLITVFVVCLRLLHHSEAKPNLAEPDC